MGDDFTALRHAAGQGSQQAGDGVHVFLEIGRDQGLSYHRLKILERCAAVGLVDPAGTGHHLGAGGFVVFIVDLADHRLDQVLQRHQSVGAAEFIDHQGHVNPAGLHLDHQVVSPHRAGHIEYLTAQPAQHRLVHGRAARLVGQHLEHILDVDLAHRIVERVAIDRHPGMLGLDETGQDVAERAADLHSHDVGPRRHHVLHLEGLEGFCLIDKVDGTIDLGRFRRRTVCCSGSPPPAAQQGAQASGVRRRLRR